MKFLGYCLLLCLSLVISSFGQDAQSDPTSSLPRLVKYTGAAPAGTSSATFAIYASQDALVPLWLETQNVTVDETGHFTVLLGATKADGLPSSIFLSGEARWIGVTVGDAPESARSLLVSVPYALKAGDAETLGGKPLSAFVMAEPAATSDATGNPTKKAQRLTGSEASRNTPEINGAGDSGTLNFLAKFAADNTSLISSGVIENSSGFVGIGTSSPLGRLHVASSNAMDLFLDRADPSPNQAGFLFRKARGNLSSPGIIAAGDGLMYLIARGFDGSSYQNAAAILAESDGSPSLGSMPGRMIFATSPAGSANLNEAMRITNSGFVGIGTSTPLGRLHVASSTAMDLFLDRADNSPNQAGFLFRKARGNLNSPLLIQAGDGLMYLIGRGFDGSAYQNAAGITVESDGTPSAGNMPGRIVFATAAPGSTSLNERVRIDSHGNMGVGNPVPVARVDASQPAPGVDPVIFSVSTPPPAAVHGDTSTTTSGVVTGIFGTTASVDGYGVLGENLGSGSGTGTTVGVGAGVRGITANVSNLGTGVWGEALQTTNDNVGVFGRTNSSGGTGVEGQAVSTTGQTAGVFGTAASSSGTGVWGESTSSSSGSPMAAGVFGHAFAGTAGLFAVGNPGAALLVGQNSSGANVFRVDSTGKVFADGNVQASGADFAESVEVLEQKSTYEPGDLIAIDTTGVRRFGKSTKPYSTLVAGIYSTKPGVLATPHDIDDARVTTAEIPLAVVGIVPCKVTNENGDINTGDLLVSSSTAGYAMKGTDRNKMTGAVVGKALQSMHTKSGVIEVLVSLQ